MTRKSRKEMVETIISKIMQQKSATIYKLSMETKINFSSVKEFVELIAYIQKLPKIYFNRNPKTRHTTVILHPTDEPALMEKFSKFLEKRGRGETISSIESLDPDEKEPIYLKFIDSLAKS